MTDPAALARHLADRHAALGSWRAVAQEYPPVVKAGTLCRIAKSGGGWMPRDRKILRALGLLERRKRTEMEKRISRMVKETRKAVLVMK